MIFCQFKGQNCNKCLVNNLIPLFFIKQMRTKYPVFIVYLYRLISSFQEFATSVIRMKERKILSVILLTSLTFLLMARFTTSCNQMLCASIVSKCLLTASCKCDLKNCTCCTSCYQCLSWLWQECCSCVGK